MPPSETEQLAQLNENAMRDVAQGGVTEFASDPGIQVAGKGNIVADLFRLFGGVKKTKPKEKFAQGVLQDKGIDQKPRVPAEGNIEPDNLNYRATQTQSAQRNLSPEGQAKFKEQGNRATDLSPQGRRSAALLAEADEAAELTAEQQLRQTVTASQRGVTAEDQGFRLTEDSSGVASQSQADEVLETARVEGFKDSIEEGAPFNFDNIKSPDDVKALIQAVSTSKKTEQTAATRGVVSNVQTLEEAETLLADDLGMTRKILSRKRGTAFENAAEATAAREVMTRSAVQLADLARQVNEGANDAVMLQFRRQLAVHNGILLQVKGATTESARVTQSFNIPVTGGMTPAEAAVLNAQTIDASGGADALKAAARGLVVAAENGPRAFNEATQAGIGSRVRHGLEHMYINGLLSGPKTQLKNIIGNALYMGFQLPEEFMAGMIGGAERGIRRAVGSEIDYTDQVYMSDVAFRLMAFYRNFGDALYAAGLAAKKGQPGDAVNKVEMNTYSGGAGDLDLGLGVKVPGQALRYLHAMTSWPSRGLLAGDGFFQTLSQNGELYVKANRQAKAALELGATRQQANDEALMVMLSPRQIRDELDLKSRHDTLMSDLGAFGKATSALQRTTFGRYVVPFATAPTNDVLRTIERSNIMGFPLGTLYPDVYKTGAKRQTALARMALGGIVTSQVAMYTMQGRITGPTPKDKKVREKLPPNWQPYSLVFRGENFPTDDAGNELPLYDKWGNPNGPLEYYGYSGLGPVASMIGISAGTVQRMEMSRNAEERQSMAGAAVFATTDYFRELPMLQGVARVLSSLDREDFSLMTEGPLGSMNLVPGVPNPVSSAQRAVDRALDNAVVRRGAPFEVYTLEDVQRLTAEGILDEMPDGEPDYRLIGLPKGEPGDIFKRAVYDGFLDMMDTNLFSDNMDANIPVYDTLGRPVTRGPTFEENPYLRINNSVNPIVFSETIKQPEWVEELVKLDWPIPIQGNKYSLRGARVALTEMQKSNLIWLAKGKMEDMPENLKGMNVEPVSVDFTSFDEAMEELLLQDFEFDQKPLRKKRTDVRSLNTQFMDAAFQELLLLPGNERLLQAFEDIQMLRDPENE